jgi:hypothetical protein
LVTEKIVCSPRSIGWRFPPEIKKATPVVNQAVVGRRAGQANRQARQNPSLSLFTGGWIMKRLFGMLLLLASAALASGADDKKAEAIRLIDKALEALGGEEKTLALPAFQGKSKGKLYRSGFPLPYTAEYAFHFPDRCNWRLTFDPTGAKIPITIVHDKGQAWEKLGTDLKVKTKEQAAEIGHLVYYIWLHQLTPLKRSEFTLEALGESKIDETAVRGVKVSCKGRRNTRLFFDAKTHHLIASETTALDEAGKEVPFATRVGGYVKVDGVGYYTTIKVSRDGKPHYEEALTEQKRLPGLPDTMFKKP